MHLSRLAPISTALVLGWTALMAPRAQSVGGVKAFIGARVIDGTERSPITGATIVVRNGRIVAVGPAAAVTVPADAQRISLTGKTVIPGLINAHGHVGNTEGLEQGHYSAANVQRDLRTYAAYGVTTVYSLGDDQEASILARDAQSTPALDRARLFVAGPVLNPTTVDEARRLVDRDKAMRVDIVKIRIDDAGPEMAPEI